MSTETLAIQSKDVRSKSSADEQTSPALSNKSAEVTSLSSVNSAFGLEMGGGPDRSSLAMQRLNDIVQVALICIKHKRMLLLRFNGALYLPFGCVKPGETIANTILVRVKDMMREIGSNRNTVNEASLVDLLYIQLPPNNEFLCRYTFRCETKTNDVCICGGSTTPRSCMWQNFEDFKKITNQLWGPEPILLLEKILYGTSLSPVSADSVKPPILQEFILSDITKYLSDALKSDGNPLSTLMAKNKVQETELYRVFIDYITNTYPSIYMSKFALQEFMNKSSLFNYIYQPERLMNAFIIDSLKEHKFYLEFDEFLFGMYFMDIDCPHVSPYAEIRTSYVFRYYSRVGGNFGKNILEFEDMLMMVKEIDTAHFRMGVAVPKTSLEDEVTNFMTLAGIAKREKGVGVSYEKYIATCQKLGTSNRYFNGDLYWRLNKPISYYHHQIDVFNRSNLGRNQLQIIKRREEYCFTCQKKGLHRIAEHTVKTLYNGAISDIQDNEKWINEKKRGNKLQRVNSNKFFNSDYFPNMVIDAISDFADEQSGAPIRRSHSNKAAHKGQTKNKWNTKFVQANLSRLTVLCNEVEQLLKTQEPPPVLRLSSPCVLVTEFSGKLFDLMNIERHLSYLISFCFPTRYVYMINWTDFSRNGLELLFFWMANKILMPDKYHICLSIGREDKKKEELLRQWLYKQCENLIGKEFTQFWNALCQLMDCLQRSAVIDGSVFVVPGVEYQGDLQQNLNAILEHTLNKKQNPNRKPSSLTSNSIKSVDEVRYTIFTTNEPSIKKVVYLRTNDPDSIQTKELIKIGNQNNFNRQSVILVDQEKIRVVYVHCKT